MESPRRVGVFLGQILNEEGVNLEAVASYARNLPDVEAVRVLGYRPQIDPAALRAEVREDRLDRIVLGGDSPGYLKPAFTRAFVDVGGSPDEVRLASFRENGAQGGNALERAKAVVACAVRGVPFPLVAIPKPTKVNPATLIVGAGVAGIQAALEIADAGKQVYLVERAPTIGGHMAMFDKTFPTLDCAACILTPKMVAVGDHDGIELLTCAEVQEVNGGPGAYTVKLLKRARRVDQKACTTCNACSNICPISVWSEFNCRLSHRKAIYMPFPQAVPNAYVVDPESCTWVLSQGKKCGACVKKCAKEAIHLEAQDEVVELEVGNIIVATGYETFDARRIERYGYGTYPNVLTALEFERLTNASGPTGGKIVLKVRKYNKRAKQDEWVFDPEGPQPRAVAIIHCVGSRDQNYNA